MNINDLRDSLEVERKLNARLKKYAVELEELVHELAREKNAYGNKIRELEGRLRK